MGFDGKAYGTPFKDWQQDVIRRVSEVARQYGIEREIAGSTGTHTSVATYRIEQERQEEADKLREITRRKEVARVTLEKLELDIETAKHRKRLVEADELAAQKGARQAEDEAREAEKKARVAEAQATEAETRQRIAEAAVVAARKRQDDAERELQRNAERYKAAIAKSDEAEEQAQVAEGKLSQLTEWIHRLSDIKSLVTTVLSGVVSYIDTVHTDEAKVAARFMRTHATGIVAYTAKAIKVKVEELVTGKKVIDDSTKREPVRTIHVPSNTRRPSQGNTPTV
jgi:membrane protein involved in colicin uptake